MKGLSIIETWEPTLYDWTLMVDQEKFLVEECSILNEPSPQLPTKQDGRHIMGQSLRTSSPVALLNWLQKLEFFPGLNLQSTSLSFPFLSTITIVPTLLEHSLLHMYPAKEQLSGQIFSLENHKSE